MQIVEKESIKPQTKVRLPIDVTDLSFQIIIFLSRKK